MPSGSARTRKSTTATTARSKTETSSFRPRAVIFDIDGTLADSGHRVNRIKDWKNATDEQIEEYASLYHLDTPIAFAVELARTLHTAGYAIVLLTSRDVTQYERTCKWMRDFGVPFTALYVRETIKDRRPNQVYKLEQLARIREKFSVEFAVEDEARVAEMFWSNGVPCMQVRAPWTLAKHSGDNR